MKVNLFKLLPLLVLLMNSTVILIAQNDQKVEFEKVTEQCENLPFEEKVRIAVADFRVASPKVPYREFGAELAVMLTNALSEINCFRVLEKISVMQSSEVAKEGNLAKEGTVDNYLPTDNPNMLKSQAIVTGDITEFSSTGGKTTVAGIGLQKPKVRFGFILKVIDPRTRELLWSKSLEVVSKKGGVFSGLQLGGFINIAGSNKYNKAEVDALERGIIKAMYALAEEREEIRFPEADNSNVTLVEVDGTDFMKLQKLMNALKADSQLKSVTRIAFKNNKGKLELKHDLKDDDILNIVAEKGAGQVEITGFQGNIIQVKTSESGN